MQNIFFESLAAKKHAKNFGFLFAILIFLSACQPSLWGAPPPPTMIAPTFTVTLPPPTFTPTFTPTFISIPATGTSTPVVLDTSHISVSSAVPALLREQFLQNGFQVSTSPQASSALTLDAGKPIDGAQNISTWTYALVAPFPTLADDITSQDLLSAWSASSSGPFSGIPFLMDESTLKTFTLLWGEPAQGAVQIVPADQLLDTAWNQMPAWAIIPFEAIEPKWKVLTIDGQSPIQKKFDASAYPLIATYQLTCADPCPISISSELSFQNRDPKKLATVIMTGVTAMVRATAATMDAKGILYPGEAIRDMLLEADIVHINNEVPFYSHCPSPDANQTTLVFCSSPRYIQLLTDIGADVMELSGDHFADYGQDAMFETMDIYKENNLSYYGGGLNLEDGRKPYLLEVNGNKLMFIGCNYKDGYATATDTIPGSAPCDFDYITGQIAYYRSQGYLPISTFQYHEFDFPEATPQQMSDFRTMADAGAVIVSGSQAHVPQVMEFYQGAFIHYGLGNLFFDQVPKTGRSPKQNEFLDRHIFYNGKYLGVELITTFLEDYARPRYMKPAERIKFLTDYFIECGWDFLQAGQ
jgi:poly-gamma-glutamate synthesis protein (capsule biosynthesis protein)